MDFFSNRDPQRHRTLLVYGILAAIWILPPLLVGFAAHLSAAPINLNLLWPITLIGLLLSSPNLGSILSITAGSMAQWRSFWLLLGLELSVAATVVGLVAIELGSRGPGGEIRWARRWDLRRAGLLARRSSRQRLSLGRWGRYMVAARSGVSLLIFGPTGSGKTAGFCIPQILEWEGAVVAISIKSDLVLNTAGVRQRRGPTDIYDPTGITGLANCTWSPLQRCQSWDRAMRMGQWLVQGRSGYGRSDPEWEHWEDAAIRLVSCALYAGASIKAPISEVLSWLDDGSGEQLGLALARVARIDQRALQWYYSVQERPERERGSCYSTSQRVLRPYIEREVANSASDASFDPHRFLTAGCGTLYIVAPQSEQERLSGIFTSLIMTIMTEAAELALNSPQQRLPQPLLMMLDECANTAPLRELPGYLSTVRSMGISIVAIFQDLAQCEARYHELAGSLVNNARALLFLSGSKDRKTLELLRDLLGKRVVQRTVRDTRGGAQISLEPEEMLPMEMGRQIKPGQAVLLYEHLPPAFLHLRSCYHDPRLIQIRNRFPFYPQVSEIHHSEGSQNKPQRGTIPASDSGKM
ncbi:MAG: type IV secretory system conjugative DNA transfer family protein [Candidatus Dormibacteraceae bacterium]